MKVQWQVSLGQSAGNVFDGASHYIMYAPSPYVSGWLAKNPVNTPHSL
jgi:hypothetical protein